MLTACATNCIVDCCFVSLMSCYISLRTTAGNAIAHLSHCNSICHTNGSVKNSAS